LSFPSPSPFTPAQGEGQVRVGHLAFDFDGAQEEAAILLVRRPRGHLEDLQALIAKSCAPSLAC